MSFKTPKMSYARKQKRARSDFPVGILCLLALSMFIAMTIEFMPTGLLSNIATEFGINVALAGQLVTIFAVTVVVAATALARLTYRFSRKNSC